MKYFPTNSDSKVIIITTIVLIVISFAIFALFKSLPHKNLSILRAVYFISIFIILVPLYFIFKMPTKISVSETEVRIHYIVSDKKIDIDGIKSVNLYQFRKNDRPIRIIGSGGLFGYIGHFKNDELGDFYMYVKNIDNMVLIKTNKEPIIISCKNPEDFVSLFDTNNGVRGKRPGNQNYSRNISQ